MKTQSWDLFVSTVVVVAVVVVVIVVVLVVVVVVVVSLFVVGVCGCRLVVGLRLLSDTADVGPKPHVSFQGNFRTNGLQHWD